MLLNPSDIAQTWVTTEGGAESIDEISQKYLGIPYPNFTGKPEPRVLITVEADKVTPPARD